MTQLPKAIMLDLTHQTILKQVKQLQKERNLTNCEMELVLTQVLNDIKTEKEADYSETILDLVYQLQQKEQSSEEPEMTPIVTGEAPLHVEFTPDKIEVNSEQE